MHVIETAGLITSDGTLQVVAHVPAQIPRGECRVLVVIEEGSRPPESPAAVDLPVLPVTSGPTTFLFIARIFMATGAAENLFVDTNILVYATVASAPLHLQAKEALARNRKAGKNLWINRQVLREYLAVLSRPQTFTPALDMEILLEELVVIESSFFIAEDGPKVTEKLTSLLRQIPSAGKQVLDANIVATMLANNIPAIITHNTADYARYIGVINVVPLGR